MAGAMACKSPALNDVPTTELVVTSTWLLAACCEGLLLFAAEGRSMMRSAPEGPAAPIKLTLLSYPPPPPSGVGGRGGAAMDEDEVKPTTLES